MLIAKNHLSATIELFRHYCKKQEVSKDLEKALLTLEQAKQRVANERS